MTGVSVYTNARVVDPSRGIDEIGALKRLSLRGFHVYSGSQCLDDEALADHFWGMWTLFRRAAAMAQFEVSPPCPWRKMVSPYGWLSSKSGSPMEMMSGMGPRRRIVSRLAVRLFAYSGRSRKSTRRRRAPPMN